MQRGTVSYAGLGAGSKQRAHAVSRPRHVGGDDVDERRSDPEEQWWKYGNAGTMKWGFSGAGEWRLS